MDGSDWLRMVFGMGIFWIVVISLAAFIGVRLAQRPHGERRV